MSSRSITRQSTEAAAPGPRPASGGPALSGARTGDDVVVLLLADFAPGARLWGWARMVLGPRAHRDTPGLRLVKVLGSGHEGGFGLRPSASRQGLFLVFDGEAAADAFLAHGRVAQAYRAHAREFCTVKLRAFASRGHWDGRDIAVSAAAPAGGTVAALTRASIRPLRAAEFWRLAPPAEASLAGAPGCRLAVGLGEAPLLRQATFSLWDDQAAMDAYSRSGAHLEAI
ncbi:MAG TPA: spheroidene monooxygenase, partial [Rubrivivax sp.]|nr:spheroidene monooxygenase [Rubrivivax sp.]